MIPAGGAGAQTIQSLPLIGATGIGGRPKTQSGRNLAVKHFSKYLFFIGKISSEAEQWEQRKAELEIYLCTPECFQVFAGYLVHKAKKQNGENYDKGMAFSISAEQKITFKIYFVIIPFGNMHRLRRCSRIGIFGSQQSTMMPKKKWTE